MPLCSLSVCTHAARGSLPDSILRNQSQHSDAVEVCAFRAHPVRPSGSLFRLAQLLVRRALPHKCRRASGWQALPSQSTAKARPNLCRLTSRRHLTLPGSLRNNEASLLWLNCANCVRWGARRSGKRRVLLNRLHSVALWLPNSWSRIISTRVSALRAFPFCLLNFLQIDFSSAVGGEGH
jgi:hypothetical protein